MFFQILKCGFPLDFELLVAHARDYARASAVAAIGGATVGDEKQHAIGVAMHQTRNGHMAIFAAGVSHFIGSSPAFFHARNDLTANWAIGIVAIDELEKMRSDGHRKFVTSQQYACAFFGA